MAVTVLPDCFMPLQTGKIAVIVDLDGPSTYAPVTGQALTAQACMMSAIDYVSGGLDSTCAYLIAPKGQYKGSPATSVQLLWVTASTMAEAGAIDLSSYHARLLVVGV